MRDLDRAPRFVAEGLGKRYGGVQAVREAWVSMRPGEVRGLIGANGAGKSTFMKMLTGRARPDRGSIRIDGAAIDLTGRGAGRRAGVELMPQELAILPNLTVAENVVPGSRTAAGWNVRGLR
ncbi:ATP-binding cassette domain-containing protein [Nocardioides sp. B-3]|uniref:ATP-binding cassette domain-containing protein n=1 Tax=Nocardioides sp. B-3 TaxID=2895565 RepID=UPI00215250C9|nr:ATP-binding cassette domain-containing protein [Nocardioides sp. B-3]UUZ59501.1 ATP-binding cassette domain-containing protein [Nocardioides sp. B-3]